MTTSGVLNDSGTGSGANPKLISVDCAAARQCVADAFADLGFGYNPTTGLIIVPPSVPAGWVLQSNGDGTSTWVAPPAAPSTPFILFDSRNWTGGTNPMVNEGTAGSTFNLVISSGYGTNVVANTAGSPVPIAWADVGGVPSSSSFTFMFSIGDYSDPGGALAGIVFQTSASPLCFIEGVVDQEFHPTNLNGTIDGTLQVAPAHSTSGFNSTYRSNSTQGFISFANHFWMINVDCTVSGGQVHIWRDGVLQDADPRMDTYFGDALTPSRANADIAAVNFFAYMGPRAAATPAPPGLWASSCRGMGMFRGAPSASDRAYWQAYFA